MSTGTFAFTPKPIEVPVIIEDSRIDDGKPFKYPIDMEELFKLSPLDHYSGFFGPLFEGDIKEALPEYAYFISGAFCDGMSPPGEDLSEEINMEIMYEDGTITRLGAPNRYAGLFAMSRFAAFVRYIVKDMGVFWYIQQSTDHCTTLKREDMVVCEIDSNSDWYLEGPETFVFEDGTFYKFV